ncbi:PREDICTED: uncharacterized protein LOC109125973 [Camelina sativa]|uniref:Uncharacterized protein LOC109125973 n=1 Tax=Camelina sativa TaxID=90675 RepID=A0ABM1QC66_CAMSA|nr:PREDICTED: uncharacterized protein LOC109125973 [Camelina sativa]
MGVTGPSQTGIPLFAIVAQACSPSGWNIRTARSPQAEVLQIHLTTVPILTLSTEPDSYVWRIGEDELDDFNTKRTWESIRHRHDPLTWTDHVWYKGAIPRHAIMLWLTHLNRLPTRDMLVHWGMHIENACCICGAHPETRDHLFLHCEFTEEIWLQVTRRLGYRPIVFHTWQAFAAWMDIKDSTTPQTLRRFVSQAVIYAIWYERNNRFHNNIATPPHIIFKAMDIQIRDAILAKSHCRKFKRLMQVWLRYL